MSITDIEKDDFDREISEVKAFVNSQKGSFPDMLENALKSAVRYEYTTVECNGTGGWYNPDYYLFLVGGYHRGKIKKCKSKPQKYGYEYGFDENGRLITTISVAVIITDYIFITVKMCIGSVAFT